MQPGNTESFVNIPRVFRVVARLLYVLRPRVYNKEGSGGVHMFAPRSTSHSVYHETVNSPQKVEPSQGL